MMPHPFICTPPTPSLRDLPWVGVGCGRFQLRDVSDRVDLDGGELEAVGVGGLEIWVRNEVE